MIQIKRIILLIWLAMLCGIAQAEPWYGVEMDTNSVVLVYYQGNLTNFWTFEINNSDFATAVSLFRTTTARAVPTNWPYTAITNSPWALASTTNGLTTNNVSAGFYSWLAGLPNGLGSNNFSGKINQSQIDPALGGATDNSKIPTNNGTAWNLTIVSGSIPYSLITSPPWLTTATYNLGWGALGTNVLSLYETTAAAALARNQREWAISHGAERGATCERHNA